MKNEVLVSIKGLHRTPGDEGSVELVTYGRYYQKEGKGYLFYTEIDESNQSKTENRMEFSENELVLRKNGAVCVHMVFDVNKKSMAEYRMAFGLLEVGIETHEIILQEKEDEIKITVTYGLDVNGSYVSDSTIEVVITPITSEA